MNWQCEKFTANDYKSVLPYFSRRSTYTCESHFLYHVIWKDFYNSHYCLTDEGVLWIQTIGESVAALPPIASKNNFNAAFLKLQDYFTNEPLKCLIFD